METFFKISSSKLQVFYWLSRLLQIGINGNFLSLADSTKRVPFPDYFKSELMETRYSSGVAPDFPHFPDYFKSELMETLHHSIRLLEIPGLSRLLQIGINGNFAGLAKTAREPTAFPDYFKSELMETNNLCLRSEVKSLSRLLQIGINGNDHKPRRACVPLEPFPITSNRN